MSRRQPQEQETKSDNTIAVMNQVMNNRYWFLPVQYSIDKLDPLGLTASPIKFSFRFPDFLQYESGRNSIYQIEMVQYSLIRSAPGTNEPIFLLVDFNGDTVQTPYLSVISSSSTDGVAFPMTLQDKLSGRNFTIVLAKTRTGSILATGENITDVIITFKYSIRSI